MDNFKMGPLQTLWVESLRAHPERQMYGRLGVIKGNSYMACCLGELLLCHNRLHGVEPAYSVFGGELTDGKDYQIYSLYAYYEVFGLNSPSGAVTGSIYGHDSLSEANDDGVTWLEIADFIENNPEKVFTHAV